MPPRSVKTCGGCASNGAAVNAIETLIRLGRYDEAQELLDLIGDEGVGSCTTTPSLLRVAVSLRRGRWDEARRSLAVADELSARLADVQVRGLFHLRAAELAGDR